MTTSHNNKSYLYKRVVQAKLFIDDHYAGKLDVNSIADEACFSKFHFIRLFKKMYGKTPHQYLISVRIDQAARLLKKGEPVSTVCFSVGFESVSSFSGLFKRLTGKSPLAFLTEASRTTQQTYVAPLNYIPGCFAHMHGWGGT